MTGTGHLALLGQRHSERQRLTVHSLVGKHPKHQRGKKQGDDRNSTDTFTATNDYYYRSSDSSRRYS